jgi:hypothetical protein
MISIPVDPYPIAPTFSSMAEAIRHAESYLPLAKAKADEQLVFGSYIVDAYWSDTDFVIRFSNGRFFHIFIGAEGTNRSIRWGILDSEPKLPEAELMRVGSPPVILVFRRDLKYTMDRSAMIQARRGQEVKRFFVNEQCFYLYTSGQGILCFDVVLRRDTGGDLLYVYEED